MPRAHMDSALSGMADEFLLIPTNSSRRGISNPETFLKHVLSRRGVPVVQETEAALFPVTDGRCENGRSFCVVRMRKDCRPAGVSVNVCTQSYFHKRGAGPRRRANRVPSNTTNAG